MTYMVSITVVAAIVAGASALPVTMPGRTFAEPPADLGTAGFDPFPGIRISTCLT